MSKPMRLHDLQSAAQYLDISPNAVYMALTKNKIKHKYIDGRVFFEEKDLDDYYESRYDRDQELFRGKKIFSKENGLFSIPAVADILTEETNSTFTPHSLYYFIRTRQFPAVKIKNRWVINQETLSKMIDFFKYRKAIQRETA